MEETAGAPSSFAALSPRRLRASSRDGGGVVNRPPSSLTMLLSRHTRRREFVSIGLLLVNAARPAASQSSSTKSARIGVLSPAQSDQTPIFHAFREGLRELGYVEG